MAEPDRELLTADLIIETGGWHPAYARVVLIAAHEDVAIVFVDGNGDGSELEMESWIKDAEGWVGGSSNGYGHLDNVSTATWDAGPIVCALGKGAPGQTIVLRHDGELFETEVNEFGLWGFVHKTVDAFSGRLLELVDPPDDRDPQVVARAEEIRRQMRERLGRWESGEARPPEGRMFAAASWVEHQDPPDHRQDLDSGDLAGDEGAPG